MKGSIRIENVEYPAQYVEAVLQRVQPRYLQRTYEVKVDENTTATEFLELLARKGGRLLKGGEPDLDGCAKIVLNDWIRGKIPWFIPPPKKEGEEGEPVKGVEGRDGRLGEMSKKRKRDDATDTTESVAAGIASVSAEAVEDEKDKMDDDFEGFSDDDGGLELQADDDSEEDEEDDVEGDDANEGDDGVEEEVAAISKVLATAKKAGKA